MTRLYIRPAEFDGAIRLAVAHGMTPERARAAAELLYVVPVPASIGGGQGSGGGGAPAASDGPVPPPVAGPPTSAPGCGVSSPGRDATSLPTT